MESVDNIYTFINMYVIMRFSLVFKIIVIMIQISKKIMHCSISIMMIVKDKKLFVLIIILIIVSIVIVNIINC